MSFRQIRFMAVLTFTLFQWSISPAWSQNNEEISLDDIESFLEKESKASQKTQTSPPAVSPPQAQTPTRSLKAKPLTEEQRTKESRRDVFKDVTILQKKYFPKTDRWELFAGGSTLLNDSFFLNGGLIGRASYYFSETWGVEGTVMGLKTKDRKVTRGLKDQGISTQSLVTPKFYYGVDAKWSPIYGKMAFYDESIVHYDLYFSAGLGITQIDQINGSSSEPTLHLGTGQNFAINRWMAFRWDFSWNFFNVDAVSGTASNASGTIDNLFLTVGMSFFFPEATYR